jgi:hypothetical protein
MPNPEKFDITGVLLKKKQQNMKRSRFGEEQIIGILRKAEAGSPVKAVHQIEPGGGGVKWSESGSCGRAKL